MKKPLTLEEIKQTIEKMDEKHHIHIGSILKKYPQLKLNSNKSGILVNISMIPEEIINEIRKYIAYVLDQEQTLSQLESTTKELQQFLSEKDSFVNDNKDIFSITTKA
jgi:hypothetical protein